MGTLLNLRPPLASMPASACVLTEARVRRLADMNAASRKLRELGYRIVEEQLEGTDGRPRILIDSGTETDIAPLLQHAGTPSWQRLGDRRIGRVSLNGVLVTWERA